MNRLLTGLLCLLSAVAAAQPGIDEMQQAKQQLSSSFFSAFDFAMVISTILGTVAAVKIFHNWQMGKPRIDNDVAAWFFAAIFMILSGAFLQALFGI